MTTMRYFDVTTYIRQIQKVLKLLLLLLLLMLLFCYYMQYQKLCSRIVRYLLEHTAPTHRDPQNTVFVTCLPVFAFLMSGVSICHNVKACAHAYISSCELQATGWPVTLCHDFRFRFLILYRVRKSIDVGPIQNRCETLSLASCMADASRPKVAILNTCYKLTVALHHCN